MKIDYNSCSLEILQGDITDLNVDVIVNAANKQLQLGDGVAGAIRRKGGPKIQAECNALAPINVGYAVLTSGGSLLAKHVIHAVGPTDDMQDKDVLLQSAIINSLELAQKYKFKSIALPAISTGIFGFPMIPASQIILKSCISIARDRPKTLEKIIICLFDQKSKLIFEKTLIDLK
jgi:O-acetyl-ADP-ribose deacetylase (regulator of RNase III)